MPPPTHRVTSGWTTGNTDTQPDNDSSLHNSHTCHVTVSQEKKASKQTPKEEVSDEEHKYLYVPSYDFQATIDEVWHVRLLSLKMW